LGLRRRAVCRRAITTPRQPPEGPPFRPGPDVAWLWLKGDIAIDAAPGGAVGRREVKFSTRA